MQWVHGHVEQSQGTSCSTSTTTSSSLGSSSSSSSTHSHSPSGSGPLGSSGPVSRTTGCWGSQAASSSADGGGPPRWWWNWWWWVARRWQWWWFGTSNTFRLEDGTSGGGLVGGGGKWRRLNEGSAQADDSGAFGLALAGGLAGLLQLELVLRRARRLRPLQKLTSPPLGRKLPMMWPLVHLPWLLRRAVQGDQHHAMKAANLVADDSAAVAPLQLVLELWQLPLRSLPRH